MAYDGSAAGSLRADPEAITIGPRRVRVGRGKEWDERRRSRDAPTTDRQVRGGCALARVIRPGEADPHQRVAMTSDPRTGTFVR
jgi:hypothetical protein